MILTSPNFFLGLFLLTAHLPQTKNGFMETEVIQYETIVELLNSFGVNVVTRSQWVTGEMNEL